MRYLELRRCREKNIYMKTIIAGSRDITEYELVVQAIAESGFVITEIVCGMAKGVDMLGYRYAKDHRIPVKEFPADWNTHGRAAGPIRNKEMALYADALIALWDGVSKGTKNMIDLATKQGLRVYVKRVGE